MQVGDIVRIKGSFQVRSAPEVMWPKCYGQIGVLVEFTEGLHISAAKVMVLGEVDQFYIDELEMINESR